MPLDPQAKAYLDQQNAQGQPPRSQLTVDQIRKNKRKLIPFAGASEKVTNLEERSIPVQGGEIKARIYRPSGTGLLPIFVYFHGGGFVFGDLDTVDTPLRAIANESGCIVVSVDYRLAPEYKFPVATEDCYTATEWVANNATSFHGDRDKIAVGGDSAGGNLAAVVTQMSKNQGGPSIKYQILIYPCTNWILDTQSHIDNAVGYMLEKQNVEWTSKQYLTKEEDKRNPHASPLLAENFSNLPPALIITAEFDPLRDEGELYGARLKENGVPVEITRYDGMIHGFFCLAGIIDKGKVAIQQVSRVLRNRLM